MKNFDDKFLEYLDEIELDTEKLSSEELHRIYKMEIDKIELKKVKKPKTRWKMTSGLVAACLLIFLSTSVVIPNLINPKNQTTQVVNPYIKYSDIDSAEEVLEYEVMLPEVLQDGYKQESITVIHNKILSIDYTDDLNKINYRTAQDSEDISGDYNNYSFQKEINVNDMQITLKGKSDKVYLALWKTEGQSFSINVMNGISEDKIINIIETIEKMKISE